MRSIDEIAVVVQARLSSKRIPNKMLEPFAGSTLTDICLEKIKNSKLIKPENFYFSVYEPELKELADRHGVQVWNRSEASANSEGTPITELFDWWEHLSDQYKYVVVVSACCPLLKIDTIDEFIRSYANNDNDGFLSVVEKRNYFWDHNHNLITPWPEGHDIMNTKYVKPTYETAQCLYAGRLDKLGQGIWMGRLYNEGEVGIFPIGEEEAFDIDYPDQLVTIEALYKQLVNK